MKCGTGIIDGTDGASVSDFLDANLIGKKLRGAETLLACLSMRLESAPADRLTQHQVSGSVATFAYEAAGNGYIRSQNVDGAITTFLWVDDSQLGQFSLPLVGYSSGGVSYVRMETPTPAPNGSATAFSLSQTPSSASETVFLNGIAQDPGNDYTISGAAISMTSGPASTDQLCVSYFVGTQSFYHRMETPTPAVDGSTSVFTLAHTPVSNTLGVFLNGVGLRPGAGNDYTVSGTSLTMASAPASTDKLRVSYADSAVGLPSGVSQTGMQTVTPAPDGVTRVFSFSGQYGTETVYLNGVALRPGPGRDYELSGSVLTLAVPPAATDVLLVDAYQGWANSFASVTSYYQDLVEGEILGRVTGTTVSEYGRDALGSVTSSRDGTGTLQNKYRYKPYGETLTTIGVGQTGPFLFVGSAGYFKLARLYADTSMPWRVYASSLGRFSTPDPIGIAGGMNQFGYAGADPIRVSDPLGLLPLVSQSLLNYARFQREIRDIRLRRLARLGGTPGVSPKYFSEHSVRREYVANLVGLRQDSPYLNDFEVLDLGLQPTVSRAEKSRAIRKRLARLRSRILNAAAFASVNMSEIETSWRREGGQIAFDPEGAAVLIGGNTFSDWVGKENPPGNAMTYGGVVHLPNRDDFRRFLQPGSARWRRHEHWHFRQITNYFGGDSDRFIREVMREYLEQGFATPSTDMEVIHGRTPLEIEADNEGGFNVPPKNPFAFNYYSLPLWYSSQKKWYRNSMAGRHRRYEDEITRAATRGEGSAQPTYWWKK